MIVRPVIIVGCPRSGTTLLYTLLSEAGGLWSLGMESKAIIEHHHHPRTKGWISGTLTAQDLSPDSRIFVHRAFVTGAAPASLWKRVNRIRTILRGLSSWRTLKRYGQTEGFGAGFSASVPRQGMAMLHSLIRLHNRIRPLRKTIRLLEKTPENCLRLPWLLELFPDARVIHLVRNGPDNISSLMEGWRQPHLFHGYQVPRPVRIPGVARGRWAFTLIPGWQELTNSPLEEVCARQWIECNTAVLEYRQNTAGKVPYLPVRYEHLIRDPGSVLSTIADFAGIADPPDLSSFGNTLPRVNVVSDPRRGKWQRLNPRSVSRVIPLIEPMMDRLGYDLPRQPSCSTSS